MSISGERLAPEGQQSKIQQLADLAGAINRAQQPQEIYQAVTQVLMRALAADRAAVLLFDPDGKLRFEDWCGLSDEYRNALHGHIHWQRGAREAWPIAVSDVTKESSFAANRGAFRKEGIRSAAFFPLIGRSGVIGEIAVHYNEPHEFHKDELQLAEIIAGQVAQAAERQSVESALRHSEERFRATFFQRAVGFAQTGLDGEWLLLNDRFCEILGYTQAELRAKTFLDITHPDDRDAVLEGRRQILAGEITTHSMEKRYVHKNDTIVRVKRHLSLARDQRNLPQYFIVVIEDITENTTAEEALRQSELLHKQICDNIPECIFLLDVTSDGRFKFKALNPAEEKAVGLISSEVSGRFVEDVLSEEVSEKVTAHYRRCLEAGSPISYEDELNLAAGSRYFHTNLIPLRDASGRIHRIAGCCTDLTDIRRTQEEVLARQKLESIGMLAGGIAHDFNNLLGGVLCCAELALTDCADTALAEEQLQRIRTASIRGAEIVRELMIYSGQDEADPLESVDLSRLVSEMLELLKVSISKHTVLKTELEHNLPAVLGRASQIRQIVMNLIINASEAIGDKGGVIKVTTSRAPLAGEPGTDTPVNLLLADYLKLEVSDTGGGMTEQVQAKIFDPFFSTKFAGRGLGLAVVHRVVRDHGGVISFVSAPGDGTNFEVLLPCVIETALPGHDAISTDSGKEHRRPAGTVLIVEDEELLRLAVSKMLRNKGFRVMETEDGSSALELVRAHRDEIDVVLLDMTLPGITSQVVLKETLHMRPDLKVILTSAYSRKTVDDSFPELRIEHFIRKPFRLTELVSLLQDVVSR
jgi:two-component system cell cycle sensor histidine kinase/response regulator CckA